MQVEATGAEAAAERHAAQKSAHARELALATVVVGSGEVDVVGGDPFGSEDEVTQHLFGAAVVGARAVGVDVVYVPVKQLPRRDGEAEGEVLEFFSESHGELSGERVGAVVERLELSA
jgi:hypothetical protein